MYPARQIWSDPAEFIRSHDGARPVLFFAPSVLQDTARRFQRGFPGRVTYAVKANPDRAVLENLWTAGLRGFDVASVPEIELLREIAPDAALHYNNPVRSRGEIARATELGVRSFSVDSHSELEKLLALVPASTEVSVRIRLPVKGAAYDFGSKFGADAELARDLLRRVAAGGLIPSLTFHPGTQCTDAAAWEVYIRASAAVARAAGVRLSRLNVGGGFPAHREAASPPDLEAIFARIAQATREAFGAAPPALVCEPGRGIVAGSQSLAARVRAVRDGGDVFLDDGVYGGLMEFPQIGATDRYELRDPVGRPRMGARVERVVFGPTCDSLDRLPGTLHLPGDVAEGDVLIFHGMGAYATATLTGFNGFGVLERATVRSLCG
ncbi:type III PLP-dependent enzyme [Tropicimonas sediminicola]|uniref:ornithine decarboxylase n=1 Tax=Tropicimonas sediminicola TaxID=1031541 RepID=A0A239LTR5_9RHOB|nr:type III PLP-dependent enzyme [Tropicimonas sediminicola]SNT33352.1 ornithine decarboxylase [Tropicimonas sediminicola]